MERSTPFYYYRAYELRAPEVHEYAHIKYGTLRFLRRRRKLAETITYDAERKQCRQVVLCHKIAIS